MSIVEEVDLYESRMMAFCHVYREAFLDLVMRTMITLCIERGWHDGSLPLPPLGGAERSLGMWEI